jgi:hypothetical protein
VPAAAAARDVLGDGADPVGVGHRCTAVLLNDQTHGSSVKQKKRWR